MNIKSLPRRATTQVIVFWRPDVTGFGDDYVILQFKQRDPINQVAEGHMITPTYLKIACDNYYSMYHHIVFSIQFSIYHIGVFLS